MATSFDDRPRKGSIFSLDARYKRNPWWVSHSFVHKLCKSVQTLDHEMRLQGFGRRKALVLAVSDHECVDTFKVVDIRKVDRQPATLGTKRNRNLGIESIPQQLFKLEQSWWFGVSNRIGRRSRLRTSPRRRILIPSHQCFKGTNTETLAQDFTDQCAANSIFDTNKNPTMARSQAPFDDQALNIGRQRQQPQRICNGGSTPANSRSNLFLRQ